jgi:pimeloyl-ACP methyl ester carboxylesterase
MMSDVAHRTVETNGIRMHIAEMGTGPLVLLCHGFPESWYSWRHQLRALAEAGFHAVAPDMRGYGRTDAPDAIDQYTLFHLTGDIVGLLDALGEVRAVIAGHDWVLRSHGTRRCSARIASGRWWRSVCRSGRARRCVPPL